MVYSHIQPIHFQEVRHSIILDTVPSGRDTHHVSFGCECRLHDGARTAARTQKAPLKRGRNTSY